jgi:NADH-quinone oxidoreductase subunit D
MHEKMGENRTWAKFLPNTSRIDYLSAMHYTHAFVGAVERAAKIEVPVRAEYARVITSELNRISSHMVWWGALLLDLGGFTPILYAFDDREKILDLLEALCGARLTYCYYRFGGLYNDVDDAFLKGTRDFVAHMKPRLKMYRELVTDNIILRKRLTGIGPISAPICAAGTAPPGRSSAAPAWPTMCAGPSPTRCIRSSTSRSRPTPRPTRWRATWCAWTRWNRACSSSSRPSTRCPTGPFIGKVPRVLKLPVGDTCYAVEAARGRFMVPHRQRRQRHSLPGETAHALLSPTSASSRRQARA